MSLRVVPGTVATPTPTDGNLLEVVRRLKQSVDSLSGQLDPLNRVLTVRDAQGVDLGQGRQIIIGGGGGGTPVSAPAPAPDGYDPGADLSTPPAPTGFTVSPGYTFNILRWDAEPPTYRNPGVTEVWASTTNSLASAVLIGTSQINFFNHEIGAGQTRYYWIRYVSASVPPTPGPYNSTTGTVGTTAIDVAAILAALSGQIRETELYSTLASRIDLIDGPSTLAGSVAARILAEANTRAAAITSEATTRQTEDESLASSIDALTAAVDDNAAAILNEQTARVDGDSANALSIAAVAAQVSGLKDGNFQAWQTWDFNGTADGWSATGGSMIVTSDVLAFLSSSTDPILRSPATSFSGERYNRIRAYVRRRAGTGWDGTAFYTTSGHGESASFRKTIPDTTVLDQWVLVEWDMLALTAGGDDWRANTITSLRLDLGTTAADQFDIDWISVGRVGPSISQAAVASLQQAIVDGDSAVAGTVTSLAATVETNRLSAEALVNAEQTARVTAVDAVASDVTDLQVRVGDAEAAISTEATTRATADGHLGAQYTVRVQVGSDGRTVAGGFGISGTSSPTAGPLIDFGVVANRFWIAPPAGTPAGATSILPFIVQATPFSDNGVTRPAGVYMNAAYITNLVAVYATIGSLVADQITAADIAATQITAGSLRVGGFLQSTNYSPGVAGWRILASGAAEFNNNVTVRGTVIATAGSIGGVTINASSLSAGYTPGSAGWIIRSDGTAEMNNITVRGTIVAVAGSIGGIEVDTNALRSTNFVAGSAGFRLDAVTGNAEFNNVTIRSSAARVGVANAQVDSQFVGSGLGPGGSYSSLQTAFSTGYVVENPTPGGPNLAVGGRVVATATTPHSGLSVLANATGRAVFAFGPNWGGPAVGMHGMLVDIELRVYRVVSGTLVELVKQVTQRTSDITYLSTVRPRAVPFGLTMLIPNAPAATYVAVLYAAAVATQGDGTSPLYCFSQANSYLDWDGCQLGNAA